MENKYKIYKGTFTGTILAKNEEEAKEEFLKCMKEFFPNVNNLTEVDKYIVMEKQKK